MKKYSVEMEYYREPQRYNSFTVVRRGYLFIGYKVWEHYDDYYNKAILENSPDIHPLLNHDDIKYQVNSKATANKYLLIDPITYDVIVVGNQSYMQFIPRPLAACVLHNKGLSIDFIKRNILRSAYEENINSQDFYITEDLDNLELFWAMCLNAGSKQTKVSIDKLT